jgi:oligoribonuclease (3'-5' exoribonuclease)
MKYVSIDLEMTGLNPDTCDILEMGAVLDDLENPLPLEELPRFHCYFLPMREGGTFSGEPYALQMHPKIFLRIDKREKPYDYISPRKMGNSFKNFLLKHDYITEQGKVYINVAGKNFANCDLNFLNKQTDLEKHVHIRHTILDPGILYMTKRDRSLPGLGQCLARAGFEGNVAHTAVEDAMDVVKVIRHKFLDEGFNNNDNDE